MPTATRLQPSTFARAYRAGDVSAAAPGTPIPFVLSTPGKKRDGADLAPLPFLIDNYGLNPVVTAWHDYGTWPVGRGQLEVVGGARAQTLNAQATFDIEDPVGAVADRKYRQGWMHAVSLGWETVDDQMVPARISKRTPIGHDVLEFAIVTVPADWDALMASTPTERMGVRSFLREAYDVVEDAARRAELADVLRQWELCDGEACARMAGGVLVTAKAKRAIAGKGGAAKGDARAIMGVDVSETVATYDEESYAMGSAQLTDEQKTRITEAVLASIAEDTEALTFISVAHWMSWWGENVGEQRARVTLSVALPPDLVEELAVAAVTKAAAAGDVGTPGASNAEGAEARDEPAADEAGAEARWHTTARAMVAALWVTSADEADDARRKAAYKALLPEYRRQGKTPPRFLPAAIMAALPDARRRGLFVEGELEGPGMRVGKKLAKRTMDRLTTARDILDEVLAEAEDAADDTETRGARTKRSCGCGSGQSAEEPEGYTPGGDVPAELVDELAALSERFPGFQIGLVSDPAPEPADTPATTADDANDADPTDEPADAAGDGDTPADDGQRAAQASALDRLASLFKMGAN